MNKKVLGVALWLCSFAAPSAKANAAAEPLRISYTLKSTARVSLNIYDAKGQIVRELLHTASRKAGAQAEQWDGRDDAGKPLPAGQYSWKMLGVPGFGVEYITSLGSNITADEKGPWWALGPGCHGGPQTVAVDGDGFYVGAFSENIETTLLKQSLSGSTRAWSARCPAAWEGFTSLTTARGVLWGYAGNGKIYRYDVKTGEKNPTVFYVAIEGENAGDFTVDDKSVIAAFPKAGKVRWLDDAGKETRSVAVAGALTADVARDGTVYVLAGASLWKIAPGANDAQELVKDLVAPRRAAVNQKNGEITVLESDPSNQVKRFSPAGKLLKTYGAKGGRTDGLYQNQRTSFRGALDIAVEDNGNFWVAEGNAAPRRTAKFAVDGSLRGEWYGGQVWAPWVAPEPDNPRMVWMASHWGDMMRLEVDYAKKSWKIHSTYRFVGMADGLVINHTNGHRWEARVHNGTLYLCRTDGTPEVFKVDRVNNKLIPVVRTIGGFWHDPDTYPKWARDKAAAVGAQSMLWTDINGDGRPLNADGSMQANELQFFTPPAAYAANSSVAPNFDWITAGGKTKFSVTGWTASGAPVYSSFPSGEAGVASPPKPLGAYDDRWSTYVTSDEKGNTWAGFNTDMNGWGNSGGAYLARWNGDKNLVWTVGKKGGTPGTLKTLRHIYGVVNDCLVIGAFSYEWPADGITPTYVFDKDGLYAGQIFGKPLNTSVANWRYGLGGEALSGAVIKISPDEVMFYGTWINEARVYRTTGWNNWQRAMGKLEIPANFAASEPVVETNGPNGNGTGLKGEYFTSPDCSGAPAMTRVDASLDIAPAAIGSYSVRWTGTLTPRRSGWHMFEQSRGWHCPNAVWINGANVSEMVLLPAGSAAPGWPGGEYHAGAGRAIWLDARQEYSVRIDYRRDLAHDVGEDGVLLQWSEPETNGAFSLIPTSQLSPNSAASTPASTPAASASTKSLQQHKQLN